MRTYKARSLSRDVARCLGSNCRQKDSCARHLQIKFDKEHNVDTMWIVYADALRNSAEPCEYHIGEL